MEATAITPTEQRGTYDLRVLLPELAADYRSRLEYVHNAFTENTTEETLRVVGTGASAWDVERARTCPPDEFDHRALEALWEVSPEEAQERWEAVKAAAREELEQGKRSALALEGGYNELWSRAQYLAIRQDMADQLRPTGGVEWALVETMAQAYNEYLRWVKAARAWNDYDDAWGKPKPKRKRGEELHPRPEPPRLTYAESADRSHELADRYNRLFLRNLRAFRDLRRLMGPVNINAGQVNIANGPQQVNVTQERER